jgi:cardiolipin synthase
LQEEHALEPSTEISLFVYDASFTKQLRELQQSYIEDSVLLDVAVWARRSCWERLLEGALRLVSPLL